MEEKRRRGGKEEQVKGWRKNLTFSFSVSFPCSSSLVFLFSKGLGAINQLFHYVCTLSTFSVANFVSLLFVPHRLRAWHGDAGDWHFLFCFYVRRISLTRQMNKTAASGYVFSWIWGTGGKSFDSRFYIAQIFVKGTLIIIYDYGVCRNKDWKMPISLHIWRGRSLYSLVT